MAGMLLLNTPYKSFLKAAYFQRIRGPSVIIVLQVHPGLTAIDSGQWQVWSWDGQLWINVQIDFCAKLIK